MKKKFVVLSIFLSYVYHNQIVFGADAQNSAKQTNNNKENKGADAESAQRQVQQQNYDFFPLAAENNYIQLKLIKEQTLLPDYCYFSNLNFAFSHGDHGRRTSYMYFRDSIDKPYQKIADIGSLKDPRNGALFGGFHGIATKNGYTMGCTRYGSILITSPEIVKTRTAAGKDPYIWLGRFPMSHRPNFPHDTSCGWAGPIDWDPQTGRIVISTHNKNGYKKILETYLPFDLNNINSIPERGVDKEFDHINEITNKHRGPVISGLSIGPEDTVYSTRSVSIDAYKGRFSLTQDIRNISQGYANYFNYSESLEYIDECQVLAVGDFHNGTIHFYKTKPNGEFSFLQSIFLGIPNVASINFETTKEGKVILTIGERRNRVRTYEVKNNFAKGFAQAKKIKEYNQKHKTLTSLVQKTQGIYGKVFDCNSFTNRSNLIHFGNNYGQRFYLGKPVANLVSCGEDKPKQTLVLTSQINGVGGLYFVEIKEGSFYPEPRILGTLQSNLSAATTAVWDREKYLYFMNRDDMALYRCTLTPDMLNKASDQPLQIEKFIDKIPAFESGQRRYDWLITYNKGKLFIAETGLRNGWRKPGVFYVDIATKKVDYQNIRANTGCFAMNPTNRRGHGYRNASPPHWLLISGLTAFKDKLYVCAERMGHVYEFKIQPDGYLHYLGIGIEDICAQEISFTTQIDPKTKKEKIFATLTAPWDYLTGEAYDFAKKRGVRRPGGRVVEYEMYADDAKNVNTLQTINKTFAEFKEQYNSYKDKQFNCSFDELTKLQENLTQRIKEVSDQMGELKSDQTFFEQGTPLFDIYGQLENMANNLKSIQSEFFAIYSNAKTKQVLMLQGEARNNHIQTEIKKATDLCAEIDKGFNLFQKTLSNPKLIMENYKERKAILENLAPYTIQAEELKEDLQKLLSQKVQSNQPIEQTKQQLDNVIPKIAEIKKMEEQIKAAEAKANKERKMEDLLTEFKEERDVIKQNIENLSAIFNQKEIDLKKSVTLFDNANKMIENANSRFNYLKENKTDLIKNTLLVNNIQPIIDEINQYVKNIDQFREKVQEYKNNQSDDVKMGEINDVYEKLTNILEQLTKHKQELSSPNNDELANAIEPESAVVEAQELFYSIKNYQLTNAQDLAKAKQIIEQTSKILQKIQEISPVIVKINKQKAEENYRRINSSNPEFLIEEANKVINNILKENNPDFAEHIYNNLGHLLSEKNGEEGKES